MLSAGTGAANNLIRSLKVGEPTLFVVGAHAERFVLKKSPADRNHLIPPSTHRGFLAALGRVIKAEKIALVIPGSDSDVDALSRLRDRIPCRVFMPRRSVIDLCQDKYNLTAFLRARGLPAPLTYPVTTETRCPWHVWLTMSSGTMQVAPPARSGTTGSEPRAQILVA